MSVTGYDSRPATRVHIHKVYGNLHQAICNLQTRGWKHDASKLVEPELSGWDSLGDEHRRHAYGTEGYKAALRAIKPTIEMHYAANDHHPEHYGIHGVGGMSLLSMLEMLCDWRAAFDRGPQTMSFAEGLVHNQARWGYSDDIADLLHNTAAELDML